MEDVIKVVGLWVNLMVLEYLVGQMDKNIRVNTFMG